jgi:NAD-dependent deacetylase
MKPKLTVLTGAGISAESGISTFRDNNGLWENHDVTEVASPQAWRNNPELVLRFYNARRRQLKTVDPNPAHHALVDLEADFDVTVITQNVDDLHERAGSSRVIHLHGELRKVRSTTHPELIYDWSEDLTLADRCERGAPLRPHIVWFGEAVPEMERAAMTLVEAQVVLIIGTSMQVYPAAGLVGYAPPRAAIYYVDPSPTINYELQQRLELAVIAEPASVGVPRVVSDLRRRD